MKKTLKSKFYQIIDLYGLSVPLRYHQRIKFNTICGSILSLITIITIITILINFVINIINHSKFSIIQDTIEISNKNLINFSNIPILIGFINDGGRPLKIDETYLSIILDKNEHYPEKDENGIFKLKRISKRINLEYCDLNKHFGNDKNIINLIKDYEYQNYLCPIPNQNLTIGGRWGDSVHGYDMLEFHIIKCENNSIKNNCKNESEMEKFFKNSYMSIIYLSQALNHHNFKHPINYNFRSEVFLIVSEHVKRYYYYFLPGEYLSDDGIFFVNKKKYNFFDYQTTIIDFVDEEDQSFYSKHTLIEVSFTCMDRFIKVERNYQKFQDCFGNIGIYIRIIVTIFQFISNYFSEKIFLIDVINNIFPPENKYKSNIDNNNYNNTNNNNYNNNNNFKFNKLRIKKKNSNIDNNNNSNHIIINNNNYNNPDFINTNSSKMKNNILTTGYIVNNYKNTHFDSSNVNINTSPQSFLTYLENRGKIKLTFFEYICPFYLIEKSKKYKTILFYKNFIYNDISIEIIIPLIERIGKIKNINKGHHFISKLNSTFLATNILDNKKLKL